MTDPKDDDVTPAVTGQLLGVEHTDPHAPAPDAVPTAFSTHLPKAKPEQRGLDPKSLESFKNRLVEVYANGVTYKGILQGSDGEEIYLRTELRYVTVAMERVARLVPLDEKPMPLPTGAVDPTYYDVLQGEDDDEKK